MAKQSENKEKKVLLRLKKSIYKKVKDRSIESNRSVNGQIEYELDQKP